MAVVWTNPMPKGTFSSPVRAEGYYGGRSLAGNSISFKASRTVHGRESWPDVF